MTAQVPAPPPVDAGLEQLLRRMRLPHMRRIAPEVLATAKAQRWDPAEVLRALLAEEVAGRGLVRAGHPPGPGRLSHREDLRRLGRQAILHPRAHPGRAAHPGMDQPAREPRRLRPVGHREDLPARGARPGPPSKPAGMSPGSPSNNSAC
jgi:hypothetical protein